MKTSLLNSLLAGSWAADRQTLRGAVYLEGKSFQYISHHNLIQLKASSNKTIPYCHGLTHDGWIAWIKQFLEEYYFLNGKWVVIR